MRKRQAKKLRRKMGAVALGERPASCISSIEIKIYRGKLTSIQNPANNTTLICEGEKDCLKLKKLGHNAIAVGGMVI